MSALNPGSLLVALRDLLWPGTCLGCGLPTEDPILCSLCRSRATLDSNTDSELDAAGVRRPAALWKFDRDQPIRRVLHRLKYGNCPWIGYHLGLSIGTAGLAALEGCWDLILPVPLHRSRRIERGYNQAEWIALGLRAAINVEVMPRLLTRCRDTKTQTTLTREDRQVNVDGAFELAAASAVEGRAIILVDDTLTTGATLGAAARVLVEAGASIVQPVAVARATLRRDEEQPEAASVIRVQTESFFYGSSPVDYNL